MAMQPMLVISYTGQYNPYMIADVTSAVTDSQLNIVDVQQNSLHGLSILTLDETAKNGADGLPQKTPAGGEQ